LTAGRYCEAHTGHADDARPNSAARGYGARWRELRVQIIIRDPWCRAPGCGRPTTDIDHVISALARRD
jgi:hypothetical protein